MSSTLVADLLAVLDRLSGGVHAGFRPAHAKGTMYAGTFTPSAAAAGLTRAPHASRPATPVTVRFSLSGGIPTAADNDPQRSSPQGVAVTTRQADTADTAHPADTAGKAGTARRASRGRPAPGRRSSWTCGASPMWTGSSPARA